MEISVLLPAMGTSTFFKDFYFPKMLTEINGKTMLELVVENYKTLNPNYIFIFHDDDCMKFHLDLSAQMLVPTSQVLRLHAQTAGALCTCLMAIDYINNDEPLIIANSDQIIESIDYTDTIKYFETINAEAGIITFPSIHPRWSYARKLGDEVVEVAEKRPFSKNAIAGFYYYRHGSDFVNAAKKALLKQNHLDGRYYISASINELILNGKKVGYFDIQKEQFKSFYSPAKIKEYEENLKNEG